MVVTLLLIIAIIFQSIASIYAMRLVKATKYNAIWWLFIISFSLLSVERALQLLMKSGVDIPRDIFWWTGLIASTGLSVGVMYAHKLFKYIDRLNEQSSNISKRILSAILRTEEKSRSRFSKEIHDGLGPLLSSAKMSLSALSQDEATEEQRQIVADTTYLIDEAIASLREISNNLSPHVLNDFGLARGIENFINRGVVRHNIAIDFTTNLKGERFDNELEVILYRVACELINNSLKHAECSTINLGLNLERTTLKLVYCDNGKGFDPSMMELGMGLPNITSRINSLNGELDIKSSIGDGMSATILIETNQPKHKK